MSNPVEALRDYMNPTPEEVMGPYLAANFRSLMAQQQADWDQSRAKITEYLFQNLIPKIEASLGRRIAVFFQQAHFIDLGDCGGYSPHFYAIRFAEPFKPEGLFKRSIRTVVLLGDDSADHPERGISYVYVNSRITPKEKPQEILGLTLEHFGNRPMRVAKLGLPNPLATYFDTFGDLGPREFLT